MIDTAGRIATVFTLIGFSAFIAGVIVVIVRATSRLPPWPWLFILGVALGVGVLSIGAIAVAGVVGGKLVIAQRADSCIAVDMKDFLMLQGVVLVSNTDPTQIIQPARIKIRKAQFDSGPGFLRRRDRPQLQYPAHILPTKGWAAVPGETVAFNVLFHLKLRDPSPKSVSVWVSVEDQFNRTHTGTIEFMRQTLIPAVSLKTEKGALVEIDVPDGPPPPSAVGTDGSDASPSQP
jgi:hypothetical protein